MSILDQPLRSGPSAEMVVNRLKTQAYRQFQSLIENYETGLRNFWKNPNFTPQELSDALGPQAYELFALHGTIRHIIESVKPDQHLTPVSNYGAFTVNPDGTITIDYVGQVVVPDTGSAEGSGSVESGSIEPSGSVESGSVSGSVESGSVSGSVESGSVSGSI